MITITEALAELKTVEKRIEKKRQTLRPYLSRPEGAKDPLERSGGSVKMIESELQSIKDLNNRHLKIRMEIQKSNQVTPITILGITKTVAEWLTWRKEIAPGLQKHNADLRMGILQARQMAQKTGGAVVSATVVNADTKPNDIVVNVDENKLNEEAEILENILGTLDGQLSLKNATVTIEV